MGLFLPSEFMDDLSFEACSPTWRKENKTKPLDSFIKVTLETAVVMHITENTVLAFQSRVC